MTNKQLNRMRIMNGLPPVKEKIVTEKVEQPAPVVDFRITCLDPNIFVPSKGILTRYGRKMLEDGAKYYARLTVKNILDGTSPK